MWVVAVGIGVLALFLFVVECIVNKVKGKGGYTVSNVYQQHHLTNKGVCMDSKTLCVMIGKVTVRMVEGIKVVEYDHKILQRFIDNSNKKEKNKA